MRSKRVFIKFLVILCTVVLAGAGLWTVRGDLFGRGEKGGQERPPTPVTVVTAGTGTIRVTVEAIGTTRAREQVLLTADVTDKVEAINFEEGSFVEKGQLLVQLDDTQARAAVAGAVRDEARQALRRAEELDTGRFIAEADVDERRRRFETAEAEVEQARARLADYAIKAPFSGRIGIRRVSPGSLVTPETIIATLTTVDPMELHFELPGRLLPQPHPGMQVYAQRSDDAEPFDGVVITVDATVDADTRTVALKAEIPNTGGALRPGMFMMVSAVLDVISDAVLVPEEAVLLRGAESFVFVVKDGVVERVAVETGARREGVVEIREGIAAGASVVVAGLQRISDGQRVEATPTTDATDGESEFDDAPAPTRRPNPQKPPLADQGA
jgi:membrane fusion protein, multidrug efflux system